MNNVKTRSPLFNEKHAIFNVTSSETSAPIHVILRVLRELQKMDRASRPNIETPCVDVGHSFRHDGRPFFVANPTIDRL